jgi:hypothetical protein
MQCLYSHEMLSSAMEIVCYVSTIAAALISCLLAVRA